MKKNMVLKKVECGEFTVTFREYDMTVATTSGNWGMTLRADQYAYWYLYTAATDGQHLDNVHGYCMTMYMVGSLICKDAQMCASIQKAVMEYVDKDRPVDKDDDGSADLEVVKQDMDSKPLTKAVKDEIRKIVKENVGTDEK